MSYAEYLLIAKRSIVIFFALLIVLSFPYRANGCGCPAQTVYAHYKNSDIVFVGRVTKISEREQDKPQEGDGNRPPTLLLAQFEVNEPLKGINTATVTVSPGYAMTSCTVSLKAGEQYLVFARRNSDGIFYTSSCDPTGEVSTLAYALNYARLLAAGRKPNIIGMLRTHSPNTREEIFNDAKPLGGTTVFLEGEGDRFEATTDTEGMVFFENIPSGKYRTRINLSKGEHILHWSMFFNDEGLISDKDSILVTSDSFTEFQGVITTSGSLTGRLLDSKGSPMPEIAVTILTREQLAQNRGHIYTIYGYTDAQGVFRLDPLPPGEYLIVVNRYVGPANKESNHACYFPGIKDPSKAELITVSPGRQTQLPDMKVP